jgi:uncharacterized protein (TIGR03084 family)
VQQICDDLEAETAPLVDALSGIGENQWRADTPAEGWDVAETIIHLGQADYAAWLAATDAAGFERFKEELAAGRADLANAADADVRSMTGAEILRWFGDERARMIDRFRQLGPKDRIPWFGPDMGALSFATARLMETWAHGIDVYDTLGIAVEPTDRLRHVAHIGVGTRGWSYVNRGLTPPDTPIRVELTGPSGDVWTWGPEDAADAVRGRALDFCLVATQRRNLADTTIVVEGEAAEEWMAIAQAFAGPPTDTRPPIDAGPPTDTRPPAA